MLDSYVDIIDDNVGLEDNKSQFVYFFLFILQLSIHILILFIKSIIPVIVSLLLKQVKTCLIFPIYNLNGRLLFVSGRCGCLKQFSSNLTDCCSLVSSSPRSASFIGSCLQNEMSLAKIVQLLIRLPW